MMETLKSPESKLVELKARLRDLDLAREQLRLLNARHVGTLHQTDTYFDVPKGRLKLREVKAKREVELIYYEREDIEGPKKSSVFILKIRKPETFRVLLKKILKTKVVVNKKREIYRWRGTQIHLDTVKGLGTFIEFERKTENVEESARRGREVLEELKTKLGIEDADLIKGSYSDLLSQ